MRTLALLLALAPVAAAGASVFEHPADAPALQRLLGPAAATLREARMLQGGYTQTRTLQDLDRPLTAEGTFVLVKGHGMVWRTVEPFASELVVTRDALIQRDGPDAEAVRRNAGEHPGVRVVADLFFALFALDFEALAHLFELHGEQHGARWQLGLLPRRPELARTMKEIVVTGGAHVERVVLRDARGDVTDIRLRNVSVSNDAPPADELRRLFP